ncbi:Phosphopantetheine attachment site [Geosmithia morbida]|uniref:Phosphopantetheine attachment site n=1 Tax=Geosmithia morbida TaxID=1094350 RepID=A0A9P5D2Q1_9HYPO|nr:Phosphopantetheine attachment site [Geosmithia morbida]KAF4125328.1 Phosphopantetheine attachment site [Geosmithia morbida]
MNTHSQIRRLSGFWTKFYTSPELEVKQSIQSIDPMIDKALLLRSIPAPLEPSHLPLKLLHGFLTELLQYLPDDSKSRSEGEVAVFVKSTSELAKKSYTAFSDFLIDDAQPALRTTQPDKYISHRGLREYVKNFRLPVENNSTPKVAIALPNGPFLEATCIATTTYYTSAPINPAVGPEQFQADIRQSKSSFILTTPDYCDKLELGAWTTFSKVNVIFVNWDGRDNISL